MNGQARSTDNVFDNLNDALTAQMRKLQSIDPKDKEQLELCIDQSNAVSNLAKHIVRNQSNAMTFMKLQIEFGVDAAIGRRTTPKMLGGDQQ